MSFFVFGLVAFFGLILPGPDFFVVVKNTLAHSRQHGLVTAWGVAISVGVHMLFCTTGLMLILKDHHWIISLIQYVGAVYLLAMGVQSLLQKTASSPFEKTALSDATGAGYWSCFSQGFMTHIFNPKAIMFYIAIFFAAVTPQTPAWVQRMYGLEIVMLTVIWFTSIALLFDQIAKTPAYLYFQRVMPTIVGIVFIAYAFGFLFFKA